MMTTTAIARLLRTLAALLLLASAAAPRAAAQAAGGTVEGVARSAADGAPLAFLLVRLVPAAQGGTALKVLTDAAGRFRLEGVPAGEYRLQVEQIGFERTVSPVVRVEAGATLQQEIRSAMVPIQIEGLTVRAGGRCLSGAQLAEDPELAALWNEARKGVETRRAFDRQYRYTRVLRQDGQVRWRLRRPSALHLADTITNNPDSADVRAARRAAYRRANGYGTQGRGGFTIAVPDDRELFDDEFLRVHCLEAGVDRGQGTFGLRFRPIQTPRGRIGIQGAVWVDAGTYQIRRVELEHLDGERSIAQTSVAYQDVPVGGGTLRLPARGELAGRPSGMVSTLIVRVNGTLAYTYSGFERVRSQ